MITSPIEMLELTNVSDAMDITDIITLFENTFILIRPRAAIFATTSKS